MIEIRTFWIIKRSIRTTSHDELTREIRTVKLIRWIRINKWKENRRRLVRWHKDVTEQIDESMRLTWRIVFFLEYRFVRRVVWARKWNDKYFQLIVNLFVDLYKYDLKKWYWRIRQSLWLIVFVNLLWYKRARWCKYVWWWVSELFDLIVDFFIWSWLTLIWLQIEKRDLVNFFVVNEMTSDDVESFNYSFDECLVHCSLCESNTRFLCRRDEDRTQTICYWLNEWRARMMFSD